MSNLRREFAKESFATEQLSDETIVASDTVPGAGYGVSTVGENFVRVSVTDLLDVSGYDLEVYVHDGVRWSLHFKGQGFTEAYSEVFGVYASERFVAQITNVTGNTGWNIRKTYNASV